MVVTETSLALAYLTTLGRVRLSEHFFVRDMLHSEVANSYTHAAFIVDSIDQLVVWLGEQGAPTMEGPSVFGHGRRKAPFIRDPDRVIEFDEIL